jgi:hypothetical protein
MLYFYEHLRNRCYPVTAINSTFSSINWSQRQKILGLQMPAEGNSDAFSAEYCGCVFPNRNALGTDKLRVSMNFSLKELRNRANTGGRAGVTRHISAACLLPSPGAPSRREIKSKRMKNDRKDEHGFH